MGSDGELEPKRHSLAIEIQTLVEAMRILFHDLEISQARYAARIHRDKGSVSRFFSGERIPPWDFVHGLLVASTLQHGSTPPTTEVVAHFRRLHHAALESGGSPSHRIQLLQDRLADADLRAQRLASRESDLEVALQAAQRRIADLQVSQRELEAESDQLYEQQTSELTLYRMEGEAERDTLLDEIHRLKGELQLAHERRMIAEARCSELERLLGEAVDDGDQSDSRYGELKAQIEAESERAARLEQQLRQFQTASGGNLDGEIDNHEPNGVSLPLAYTMEATLDEIEGLANGRRPNVPTGFLDLDSLTGGGFRPGELIVVSAYPGTGKSIFALDVLRSCSISSGLASVLFTVQTTRQEITRRLLSAEATVASHHIESGNMTDDDWGRFARRMSEVSAAPLFISEESLTLSSVRDQCEYLAGRHALRLAVIDPINLLDSGASRGEDADRQMFEATRELKLMAKKLGIIVVAIAQMAENAVSRYDHRPVIADMRESGSLVQNADMVILLHREDLFKSESPRAGEADFIVAKNRNGPTATVTVAFQGHYCRFVDMQQH